MSFESHDGGSPPKAVENVVLKGGNDGLLTGVTFGTGDDLSSVQTLIVGVEAVAVAVVVVVVVGAVVVGAVAAGRVGSTRKRCTFGTICSKA